MADRQIYQGHLYCRMYPVRGEVIIFKTGKKEEGWVVNFAEGEWLCVGTVMASERACREVIELFKKAGVEFVFGVAMMYVPTAFPGDLATCENMSRVGVYVGQADILEARRLISYVE